MKSFNKSIILLPDEIILEEILNHLNINNSINICKTNKHYYAYCNKDLFLKTLYYKYYNNSKMYDCLKSYYETFKLCYQLDYLIKKLNLNYSIYYMYNIKLLNLNHNKLSKIPKEIGQLKHLHFLYLNDNELSEIPKEIGQLQQLQLLYLNDNKLIRIPKEIGQLQQLELLNLDYNKLTEIPKEIGQLKKLHMLYLRGNKLSKIPKEIEQLQQLIICK
jgi:Leucine-rich repeat (LRR) protein